MSQSMELSSRNGAPTKRLPHGGTAFMARKRLALFKRRLCATGKNQFELHVFLVPHQLNRIANHENQLIERPTLGGYPIAFEHATDEPFVLLINLHVI